LEIGKPTREPLPESTEASGEETLVLISGFYPMADFFTSYDRKK
jgi:hypothetical protein